MTTQYNHRMSLVVPEQHISLYNHRMTLVVPEQYLSKANQLALIAGESAADVNTFSTANWTDKDGNLYAVCSTFIKAVVLQMFNSTIKSDRLPAHAQDADTVSAQQALDIAVMYTDGMLATTDKIVIAVDIDPITVFELLGLEMVVGDDFI